MFLELNWNLYCGPRQISNQLSASISFFYYYIPQNEVNPRKDCTGSAKQREEVKFWCTCFNHIDRKCKITETKELILYIFLMISSSKHNKAWPDMVESKQNLLALFMNNKRYNFPSFCFSHIHIQKMITKNFLLNQSIWGLV